MTDLAKKRIQDLVPEVMDGEINIRNGKGRLQKIEGWQPRPIPLAVVLRAIQNSGHWALCGVANNQLVLEELGTIGEGRFHYWNLAKDNYDEQSQETKDFIGSLIQI